MKKLAILVLLVSSFTSVFAMSENSDVKCTKMKQDSAYQEQPVVSSQTPVKTPEASKVEGK